MRADKKVLKKPFVSAIVVAAGSGTRMGGVSKPFIRLGDKTAFERVLYAFGESELTDEIVVVCKDIEKFKTAASVFGKKPVRFVLGGETRGQSVYCGTVAADKKSEFFAIHDCARPLVDAEMIDAVIEAAFKSGAACAYSCVADTIKYVDKESGTIYTPDRKHLLAIQTPQVFQADIYRIAAALASKERIRATDDTALIERAGFKVEYVETGSRNFKLTTAEDVLLARAILAGDKRKEGAL